ncbi:MAG: T9SS type A sorting domain-containing protein [Limnohabitans sp.]|nr:T9SS type A sorting domain-containing protein [Limnohabitans sp.]
MKTKKLIINLSILIFSISTISQEIDWRNSPYDDKTNYYEIVNNQRRFLQNLDVNDPRSKKKIKQFERWANFWKDRLNPDGTFVPESFVLKEWQKEDAKSLSVTSRNINVANWSLVGPSNLPNSSIDFYPGMGRLNSIAFSGTNTNVLYVGSPGGGVWKSIDGGTTWTPKTDNLPNLGVSDIEIDPNNANIIYFATGDWDGGANRSIGVYKSTNGGDTWNATGLVATLTSSESISKLLIDSSNSNNIFATTKSNIKKSTDGGVTWNNVYTENSAFFNDIEYKKGSNSIIYATSKTGKFYISTNNGDTWSVASTIGTGRIDLALTDNDSNLILTLDSSGRVRRSVDQGSTWTLLATIANFDSQGGYDMTIEISPINKNLVIVGGVDGFRSTNGGTTWEKYLDGYWSTGNPYFYVHSDHHDMKFVPGSNTAFSANDGGLFRGDASLGTTWVDLSPGLAITQFYNVSGTPQNANFLLMGAQDNDLFHYNGATWTGRNPGSDGVEALWDYSNSNIAWTCSQAGIMYRTTNGFSTSQNITTPSGTPFIWELEIHPTTPTTIFGGFGDIYKSTNRGDTWTNLSSGVGAIEFISISPSAPDTIYVVGTGGTFKKTTNGGTSWTTITQPQAGGRIKSIEVHPTNPSEIYVSYSGYLAGKVYKSTDAGVTWTNITGTLPNIPTHKIVYKTGTTTDELFLATDLGVYYRNNTLGDWVKLGVGLPNVIVHDIEIHYGTERLRAATYGRGVWEVPIDLASLGKEDFVLDNNAVSVYPNPTVNGNFTLSFKNLSGKKSVIVYNIIGSIVKEINTESEIENINLNSFAKGMYLVKVMNNGKETIKKVIVQ